jgi:predicted XRE-type DNA-binding protein
LWNLLATSLEPPSNIFPTSRNLVQTAPSAAHVAQLSTALKAQVAAWIREQPKISTREIARRLNVSESTASELQHVVEARTAASRPREKVSVR